MGRHIRSHDSSASKRHTKYHRVSIAFTLVELLVATTVTLLVILAMAQAFAVVSETIHGNRATMELVSSMRGITLRLQSDLEGVTVPVRPWVQSSWGVGYFEYVDGPSNDLDVDFDGLPDATVPKANRVAGLPGFDTSLGDLDDLLMFTCRSTTSPFLGRVSGLGEIRSQLAEIIWWVRPGDTNANGVQDPGEYFLLTRRALLVRPDLNGSAGYVARWPYRPTPPQGYPTLPPGYDVSNPNHLKFMQEDIVSFLNDNDLSVRFERLESGNNVVLLAVANSLSDLTIRQNRFCHDPVLYQTSLGGALNYLSKANRDRFYPHPVNVFNSSHPLVPVYYGTPALTQSVVLPTGAILKVVRDEDVIMSNATAFDVRAYDPFALLSAHVGTDGAWGRLGVDDNGVLGIDDSSEAGWPGSDDEVVGPGDLGYGAGGNMTIANNRFILPVSRGAYVDLNFFGKYGITSYTYPLPPLLPGPLPQFGGSGYPLSKLRSTNSGTYDTWAFDYENDGIDQNGNGEGVVADGIDNNGDGRIDEFIDEGTDGLDNDPDDAGPLTSKNGVDDASVNLPVFFNGVLVYPLDPTYPNPTINPNYPVSDSERETSPPYPFPLRGIQVRIRLIEPDTRQVRQSTVISEFIPE